MLLQREQALLRDILPALIGYRLLQIGAWGFDDGLLGRAGTLCQWRLTRAPSRCGDIVFDGAHLPIASASVDALLLPHTLDLADEAHGLLRECERVLNDRGQLVVLGFNPLSPWWLARSLSASSVQGAIGPRFYTPGRVCDWLRLLDFEPERLVCYGAGFPFFRRPLEFSGRLHWSTCLAWTAQAYIIVARKRVAPRTPLEARRARKTPARKMGLANTGARRVDFRG